MTLLAVFDIDGTIANNDHRAHHVDRKEGDDKPKDWEAFLQPHLVAQDVLVEGAARAFKHLDQLKIPSIFLTGRRDSLRDTTLRWIKEKLDRDVSFEDLYMRPTGNMMKPTEFKREQIQSIKSRFPTSTLMFFDDDQYMWEVYAEFGVVFRAPQCWDVMFPRRLDEAPETLWRK